MQVSPADNHISLPLVNRFLGPSLKLRHPHRRRHGHAERSRNVTLSPLFPPRYRSFSPALLPINDPGLTNAVRIG